MKKTENLNFDPLNGLSRPWVSHIIWPVTEVVNVVTASIRDLTAECVLIEMSESETIGIYAMTFQVIICYYFRL